MANTYFDPATGRCVDRVPDAFIARDDALSGELDMSVYGRTSDAPMVIQGYRPSLHDGGQGIVGASVDVESIG